MNVLIALQAEEDQTEQNRDALEQDKFAALTHNQSMVGNGQGNRADNQDRRVDRRQTPSAHHLSGTTIRCGGQRPHSLKTGPQQLVGHRIITSATEPRNNQPARVEHGTEQGTEEHHFREDEPDHALTVGAAELLVVQTGQGFLDGVTPPEEHGRDQPQHTGHQHILSPGAFSTQRVLTERSALLNKVGCTNRNQKQTDGTEQRPGAAFGYVVFAAVFRHELVSPVLTDSLIGLPACLHYPSRVRSRRTWCTTA